MTPQKNKAARTRYMTADFNPAEKQQIKDHCARHRMTISSFLASLALEDAVRSTREGPTEEELDITLKIPVEESAKLQMFAHRRGQTLNQYATDLVLPLLAKRKTAFTSETESLRYYLSPEEHRLLKKYFKSKRLSPRTYVSYLALKVLRREKQQNQPRTTLNR